MNNPEIEDKSPAVVNCPEGTLACAVAGVQHVGESPRGLASALIHGAKPLPGPPLSLFPSVWRVVINRVLEAFQGAEHPRGSTVGVENDGGYKRVTILVPDVVWDYYYAAAVAPSPAAAPCESEASSEPSVPVVSLGAEERIRRRVEAMLDELSPAERAKVAMLEVRGDAECPSISIRMKRPEEV